MKQRIICKALAVAVIILLVGVGIQPAYADNSVPTQAVIFENTDCLVICRSSRTLKIPSGIFSRTICLGGFENFIFTDYPAVGFIYTKGTLRKWLYQGEFYGELGRIRRGIYVFYIGINDFNGIIIGGSFLFPIPSIFMGYAKEVKITTKLPGGIY